MTDLAEFSDLVRVQPFAGLIIDAATWGEAHDYHRLHSRLHLLTMHGSGIVSGLNVLPSDPPDAAILVEPGVAVDAGGEVLVVPERQRIGVDVRGGTAYVALERVDATPQRADGQPQEDPQEARGRVVESYRVTVTEELPETPALELGRVAISSGAGLAITAARNPWAPSADEIDLRHRLSNAGQRPLELRVGFVAPEEPDAHADHFQGFSNLIRAATFAGIRAQPIFASNGEIPEAELLYVTGRADAEPGDSLVEGLRERVVGGSWVFADGCGTGDAFAQALQPLTGGDGAGMSEALVSCSRYVFGAPPPGACEGDVEWGTRAIISARDYGCAWRGSHSGSALPRAQIRDALEYGVNIAACAGGYGRSR